MLDSGDKDQIRSAAALLRAAETPVRVLRGVAWPPEAKRRFFATGENPHVDYPAFDPSDTLAAMEAVREHPAAEGPAGEWILRQAAKIDDAARMLAARGTPAFSEYSRRVYGVPTDPLPDAQTTSLELAVQLDDMLGHLSGAELGAPSPACHLAQGVAEQIRETVTAEFGEAAPTVEVVEDLSANALAGPNRIRLRRTACFTDRDVLQLIHHEAYVHVATSLNGRNQTDLPILSAGHAGTTRTQEGLAVFAEMISGAMDVDRLSRLVGRVRAIQMALDGADFTDVYRFFLERGGEPDQAFESARRVFRGGVTAGGAPFTKDGVYLDGLLRVDSFLRAVIAARRTDCLSLLFCGKLDIEDIPTLCMLAVEGLCVAPRLLPPWIRDKRFLVAHLAYSAFLNQIDFGRVRAHYDTMLEKAPRVESV